MKWSADVTLHDLPGGLPPDRVPDNVDLKSMQETALRLLTNVDEDNLVPDASWKDWLCLCGTVRTFNGASTVASTWKKAVAKKKATAFKVNDARVNKPGLKTSWVSANFTFVTTQESGLVGTCSGTLGLVPNNEHRGWKIWFIASMLENFEGWANVDKPTIERPYDGSFGDTSESDFEVAIIGAGQSGLAHAGRLQALGIKYVLLERLPAVGLSWTTKYDTVRQHTIREYNNLPFERTWNADDELFLPGAKVTEGFQKFAKKYNLNVWTSADVSVRSWDSKQHQWTIDVTRVDGTGSKRTITCRNLVLAVGGGVSQTKRPQYLGEENFKGDFVPMREFKNSKKWKGKRGVVIGSGTAGHDIAQDMLDNRLSSVTIIQRQKTAIYPIEWVKESQEGLYNMNVPIDVADRISYIIPQKIGGDMQQRSFNLWVSKNQDRFDALENAGFKVDKEAVLIDKIFRNWGGYYIDVGTSKHVANGDIKVKSGVTVSQITEDGIAFSDGSKVEADLIVPAIGYDHDYRKQAATIVGDEIAEDIGEFWGLTKDGDVRGVIQESAPGLWLLAGTCGQARFWSRFVALKMKADLIGKPLVELSGDDHDANITNGYH